MLKEKIFITDLGKLIMVVIIINHHCRESATSDFFAMTVETVLHLKLHILL